MTIFSPSKLARWTEEYYQVLYYQHRNFDVKGLTTQGVFTLELEKVFVDLTLAPQRRGSRVSPDPIRPMPQKLKEGRHELIEFLTAKQMQGQHLVILGPPGSGKTTLLKHFTLTLAKNKQSEQIQRLNKLPIMIFLRDIANDIVKNPEYSLVDAIHSRLLVWEANIPREKFSEVLLAGQCMVMLDGLDEVAEQKMRKDVTNWVQRQIELYGKNRFVITSRPFGYYGNPLRNVVILEVRPFSLKQVKKFVHNWYRANELMSAQRDDPGVRMEAKKGGDDLLERLNQVPVLLEMAVNPLLLTMIATVHRYRSSLPGRRVELYNEICEVFLGKRQQARGMHFDLTPAQKQRVLQTLAYFMMRKNQREVNFDEAAQIIERPLSRVKGPLHGDEASSGASFLKMIENSSGLLIEREVGVYSFAHLTFQEYLAAAHVIDQKLEHELVKWVDNSWWHETIRLYAAQADATNVIKACLARKRPSVPALTLAMECLEEAREVRPEMRSIFRRIADSVDHHSPDVRQTAAEVFLMLRLRRFVRVDEEKYVDTTLITNGEYQLFLDESRLKRVYHQPDQWRDFIYKSGDGRKPIVGIRPSDAEAFCQWLTDRDTAGWTFRLPRANELNLSRLRSDGHVLEMEMATYWFMRGTSYQTAAINLGDQKEKLLKQMQIRFEKDWDLQSPNAKRQLKKQIGKQILGRVQQRHFVMKNLDRELPALLEGFPEIKLDYQQVQDRGLDDMVTDLDVAIEEALKTINDPSLVAARQINLEFVNELSNLFRHDIIKAKHLQLPGNMVHELFRAIERANDLSTNKKNVMYIELDRALNQALMVTRELTSVIKREKVNSRRRLSANLLKQIYLTVQSSIPTNPADSVDESTVRQLGALLDLYIDIALLEERYSGEIPALEGIRVVRVKEE